MSFEEIYGMVQIRATLDKKGKYHPKPTAPWVNYGTGDTRSTSVAVAKSMKKGGYKTRIAKTGSKKYAEGINPGDLMRKLVGNW